MDDDPVPIDHAPTARARAAATDAEQNERQAARRAYAEQLVPVLREQGAAVIDCTTDDQRDEARKAGRLAGKLRGVAIRTKVLPDGRIAVWESGRSPLQQQLDEQRANRRLAAYLEQLGPLTGTGPDTDQDR